MQWAPMRRAAAFVGVITLLAASACSMHRRPSSEQPDVAAVSAAMHAAVMKIPGVTDATVAYIPAHDLNSSTVGAEIICPRCDREGLRRVVDAAMPKLAQLTPTTKDEPSIAPIAVTRRGETNMHQWVGPSEVGFPTDFPRLGVVKRHYGL